MSATTSPPPETTLPDLNDLTVRLERVGARLVALGREGPGKKIAIPLMECVQELRKVWSSLRSVALVLDASRSDVMLEQERELRQAMEILNGTVQTLSESNERTVATMDRQLLELGDLDDLDDTDLIVGRLRTVTGNVIDAANEMKGDIVRSAAGLDATGQIIEAVDRKLSETRQQVLRDSLTRLLNRVAFEQRVNEMAAQSAIAPGSWCVALADIDLLSDFNERFGRRVGDALLFRVAGIIQATCETMPGSIVGRYGGEEFGILLPRCSLREGRQFAEEIRGAVGLSKWECKAGPTPTIISATVSIGVVEHRLGEGAASVLQRAEACAEQAKLLGRNRVAAEG